jgi:hypothetical protein
MIEENPRSVLETEGPQGSSRPVVPWPNEITGHPPSGAVPFGVNTDPETSVCWPVSPFVDR